MLAASASLAQTNYVNFEGKQTRPICLSPDGTRLFAVNTADARLSVFDVSHPLNPFLIAEIPVGVEPVSVNAVNNDEAWVVNEVSDSVSVVSVSRGVVMDTLYVQDEPSDVVFASGKAFVSAGRRNQVAVFDQSSHAPLATIPLFGTDPRAMAVSMDGTKVYAALALSGNHTTQIPAGIASNQPAPTNPSLPAPPKVSAIVDASDPNWTSVIHYRMPDDDVAEIDAASATLNRYFTNVGTILLGMAVRPDNGDLYVANTDARNLVRFEPVLRGHLVDNRVTRINSGDGSRTFYDLNPGVDYGAVSNLVALTNALTIPAGIVFMPDGGSFYVAAFGSDRVAHLDNNGNILARIEIGNAIGSSSDPRNKRGPRGLALNASAQRLYVLNRISNTLTIIDTASDTVLKEMPLGSYDPTPAVIRNGRGFLYDTKLSGNGNASCATCHVDGDNDLIAWDLGDPGGNMKNVTLTVTNGQPIPGTEHPMKGPMMTQTLRGLSGNEPFHWRGDKTNFIDFDTTFNTLLGGVTMNDPDMNAFRDFINTMTFAPNPNQNLDRTYPVNFPGGGNAQQGFLSFSNQSTACGPCILCHTMPPGTGSGNVIRPSGEDGIFQNVKQPHFRNLYQKVGFNRGTNVDSAAGFGFMHDGQEASIVTFLSRSFFGSIPATVKTNLSAFLQCWDNGMAPAVGYSRTLATSNVSSAGIISDWNLLESQAALGTNINLIVKGTIDGRPHGLLFQPGANTYKLDSTNLPALTRSQLTAKVLVGDTLTIMGVPPGSGQRMGIDRDLNGVLDADEPLPQLQISQAAGKMLLSWPLSATGFNLQQAASLDATWNDNTNPVTIVNNSNIVTNDPTTAAVYFRLRR
jgi:YVTN family beta-propeller protein